MRLRSIRSYFAVCAVTLGILVLTCAAPNAWAQSPAAGGAAKPPYNIIFVISDQEADHLLATGDFELPARAELRRRGFDFRNHYAAAAMCTPSRAAFISGTPPQVNGVFDQMETGYVPSLRTDRPNMGSVLKSLGYTTAYFGKFELNKGLLKVNPAVDYHAALQPYGFDFFNFDGDKIRVAKSRISSRPLLLRRSSSLVAYECSGIERQRRALFHGGELPKPA